MSDLCFLLKFVFRFSLLLLEPGEIYFEDFSVFHYPYDLPEEEAIKRYLLVQVSSDNIKPFFLGRGIVKCSVQHLIKFS